MTKNQSVRTGSFLVFVLICLKYYMDVRIEQDTKLNYPVQKYPKNDIFDYILFYPAEKLSTV